MKALRHASLPLLLAIAYGLTGCASPTIVIQPAVPVVAQTVPLGSAESVSLIIDAADIGPQTSKYEERGDKTLIGRSESLGVHLSDFWVEEPPPLYIQRMLENVFAAWGHNVLPADASIQVRIDVNEFSLDSRAINALQFQADGVIDVDLDVSRGGAAPVYKGNYVATCTHKTATEIPNKENMEKLFNNCIDEFQQQVQSDSKLRSALSTD